MRLCLSERSVDPAIGAPLNSEGPFNWGVRYFFPFLTAEIAENPELFIGRRFTQIYTDYFLFSHPLIPLPQGFAIVTGTSEKTQRNVKFKDTSG